MRGYDRWKATEPDDDRCIRDDSTECDCPRCRSDEDRFWKEQGEDGVGPLDDLEAEDLARGESDYEDCP